MRRSPDLKDARVCLMIPGSGQVLLVGGSRTEVGTSLVSSNLRSPSLRPSLGESRSEAGTLGLSSTLRASSLLPSVAESRNEAGIKTNKFLPFCNCSCSHAQIPNPLKLSVYP